MIMKAVVALVTFFLLLSSVTFMAATFGIQPLICCTNFYLKEVPANMVMSMKYTSMLCAKKGVTLKTKTDRDVCVDPSMEWVKMLMKNFQ